MFKFGEGDVVAIKDARPGLDLKAGDRGVVWALYNIDPPAYEVTFWPASGDGFDMLTYEEEIEETGLTRPVFERPLSSRKSSRRLSDAETTMKTNHVPIRMCVVCRQTSAKRALLRVIRRPEKAGGGVAADPTGKAAGRGAYVCAARECIEKALKQKRFERSLSVPNVPATLAEELRALTPSADPAGATAP